MWSTTGVLKATKWSIVSLAGLAPPESHVGDPFFFIAPGIYVKGTMNFDLGLDPSSSAEQWWRLKAAAVPFSL